MSLKMKTKTLDGHLYSWLEHLHTIQRMQNSGLLSVDLDFIRSSMVRLIRDGRKEGNNWIFTRANIKREGKEYVLPSVEIARFFDCDGHSKFIKLAKSKGLKGDMEDVEHSAWYPRFQNMRDACNAIDVLNKMFDEKYLR